MKPQQNIIKRLRTADMLLLLVIAGGVYARMSTIPEPWVRGHNAWGGAVYGGIARNYIKFGYGETMLGPVANSGVTTPDKFEFYYHHPPLLIWLLSLNYRILGIHEWSARALPLFFSLLSMGVLYAFVRRHFAPAVARTALIFFAVMPIETFYGMHVEVYGPLAGFFSILTVTSYLNLLQTHSKKDFALCVTGILLGCMTSWFACLAVLPILIHHHWACVRQDKSEFWQLWSLAAASKSQCDTRICWNTWKPGAGTAATTALF